MIENTSESMYESLAVPQCHQKTTSNKTVVKFKELYDANVKELQEFTNKINQKNIRVRAKSMDKRRCNCSEECKKNISVPYDASCWCDFQTRINDECIRIYSDLRNLKNILDDLLYDFTMIKKSIHPETMRDSNKTFKRWLLETKQEIHNLQHNDYEWEFIVCEDM